MRKWHRVGLRSAQSHPYYGRGGWLVFCFVYWGLYALVQIYDLIVQGSSLAGITDDQRPYFIASLVLLAGLTAYLLHTFYIGLHKIPAPEGGFRFDARFPRRMKIFLGLYLLLGLGCIAFGFEGPSRGLIAFTFEVKVNDVLVHRLDVIPNALVFFWYFTRAYRVRVTYLNQVHVYDPFLKTAEVLDPEPLTPEMVRDRHLWSAVMNSAIPVDIRTDIESKWADDAKRGRLGKRARDYLIEIHETYRGPYTPQSA